VEGVIAIRGESEWKEILGGRGRQRSQAQGDAAMRRIILVLLLLLA
jgi:hypothetical protein